MTRWLLTMTITRRWQRQTRSSSVQQLNQAEVDFPSLHRYVVDLYAHPVSQRKLSPTARGIKTQQLIIKLEALIQ